MSLASERIQILFGIAEEKASKGRTDLADRYVELSKKIGMKSQETIPNNLQKKYCSNCGSFLIPGKNVRIRINSEKKSVTYSCQECGEIERYSIEESK